MGEVFKSIDNANRLISGTPGNPTSGDPTKLGKNLLESMGLPLYKLERLSSTTYNSFSIK